ncbi:hypothetical protein Taro_019225 [Colocasia esculenta]|uniref:RRM domain-containing protein n=1 Tax=Colocasia esculenta TaxID=4460 RepID=A0A843UKK2_COLES|nr:hypothetical protein [Colocasia esculenta]
MGTAELRPSDRISTVLISWHAVPSAGRRLGAPLIRARTRGTTTPPPPPPEPADTCEQQGRFRRQALGELETDDKDEILTMADHSSIEADEQVDLDGDNDIEEMMDDEVEYAAEDDDYAKARDEYSEGARGLEGDRQGSEDGRGSDGNGHGSEGDSQGKNSPSEVDNDASSSLKDEEQTKGLKDDDDTQKHAELLALPPHGSEVFLGGVPRDATEEDLRELCEALGDIFEVRLVKDRDKKENKGYAFVTFTTKDAAQKALEEIHDKVFKGKNLRCSLSQVKHRLFIGNVPKSMTEEDIRKILEESGPGVENIEFLKVKAIYVKNLPETITSEKLKELFEHHGEITKVVLPPPKAGQTKKDFGFIHFAERASALKAVKGTEKYEIDGHVIEATLAKPQSDRKVDLAPNSAKPGLLPSYSPYPGYGYGGDPYGAYSAGYGAAGYGQPMIYGRGPMPPGMRMVPMVLPDGRIGYVLQQPGGQSSQPPPPRRGDRSGGPTEGGRGAEGSRGRRYHPY